MPVNLLIDRYLYLQIILNSSNLDNMFVLRSVLGEEAGRPVFPGLHALAASCSAHDPHEDMAVESDVSELELLLVAVLVYECRLELSLVLRIEPPYPYL